MTLICFVCRKWQWIRQILCKENETKGNLWFWSVSKCGTACILYDILIPHRGQELQNWMPGHIWWNNWTVWLFCMCFFPQLDFRLQFQIEQLDGIPCSMVARPNTMYFWTKELNTFPSCHWMKPCKCAIAFGVALKTKTKIMNKLENTKMQCNRRNLPFFFSFFFFKLWIRKCIRMVRILRKIYAGHIFVISWYAYNIKWLYIILCSVFGNRYSGPLMSCVKRRHLVYTWNKDFIISGENFGIIICA